MGTKDKRIDEYIARSADFAKPILITIRELVHNVCPQVEEVIKWSFPNFIYKGPMCSMAAFKEYCSFGFWKAAIMKDSEKLKSNQESAMGNLGRIYSLADLPPGNVMVDYIKEAVMLNDQGIKLPRRQKDTTTEELIIPHDFTKILGKNKSAYTTFQRFSPSHKKEYLEWITSAKTEETRNKRLAKAVEQIAAGKGLNWKYQKPKQA